MAYNWIGTRGHSKHSVSVVNLFRLNYTGDSHLQMHILSELWWTKYVCLLQN
jgi:hypothetical protein